MAVDLFHFRNGRTVDRREFFWEDLEEPDLGDVFSALVKQVYLDQQYVPGEIFVPVGFEDQELIEEMLTEKRGRAVHIYTPEAGKRRGLLELVARNARHSFERRFRVLKPKTEEMMAELADVLDLARPPRRIEAFDISHIQGTDIVAPMVVCEDGRMKKSDYRKFIIKTVPQNDDLASRREVVGRRYSRLQQESKRLPDLVLIDGGVGQLHAAADALAGLEIINQPLASIAKREEILYVHGRENEPIALDHHSPALHLVQRIRDEAHRFAVTFHRKRRTRRELASALVEIPGVGEHTARKLLEHFGSLSKLKTVSEAELSQIVTKKQAIRIMEFLHNGRDAFI